jgi:AcrR family transcriptional regulator
MAVQPVPNEVRHTIDAPEWSSMNEPSSPRAVRSREKILAAATNLLVESGARSVTVDAVEAASGVAKSTLYRHFSSRDELLIDTIRCNVPEMLVPDLGRGFEAALREFVGAASTAFAGSEWPRIFIAVVSLRTAMPELNAFVEADVAAKHEALATILDVGAAEGVLPDNLDPHTAANVLVGPLVFAAITAPDGGLAERDLATLADHVVDRFIASYNA